MCVCVCVCERERGGREGGSEGGRVITYYPAVSMYMYIHDSNQNGWNGKLIDVHVCISTEILLLHVRTRVHNNYELLLRTCHMIDTLLIAANCETHLTM